MPNLESTESAPSPKARPSLIGLLKTTFKNWIDENAMRLAASLAFYTVWSLGPLFLVVISVVGLVYGRAAAQGRVVEALRDLVGEQGAKGIEDAIVNAYASGHSVLANVIGIVVLLVSASGVIAELKSSLDEVWDVTPKPGSVLTTLKERFWSLTMVLGVGFLLLVSLLFNAGLSSVGKHIQGHIPGGELIWHVVQLLVSFVLETAFFSLIFKVIPDATIKWRDVWLGGVVTAALFTVGQLLIGLYVGKTSIGSAYGAASSLMIILVWIFFSSCILFLGAIFTREYAEMYGSRILPTPNAIAVPDGMTAAAAEEAHGANTAK